MICDISQCGKDPEFPEVKGHMIIIVGPAGEGLTEHLLMS